MESAKEDRMVSKEQKERVKIFISYHKEGETLQSEIMTPIHVGAARSDVMLDMQRDDEGENISAKNDRYCEITAQYWAWKNVEADYYGFMHYRRHFVFCEIPESVRPEGMIPFRRIDDIYKKYIGLSDSEIYACIKDYDVILPPQVDTSSWGAVSNEAQFSSLDNLHAIDFDLTCQTVLELYPEYKEAVCEFRTSKYAYWYNMFIMRKEIFRDYCTWLFSILEKTEPRIDFTYYNEQEIRTLAFMAERLFSIYMSKLLKDKPGLKVKHLKMTFVENTDKVAEPYPAFEENNVAVAVPGHKGRMPILGVMLDSLLENRTAGNNYDILILSDRSQAGEDMDRYIGMIEKRVKEYSDVRIRFIDVSCFAAYKGIFINNDSIWKIHFRLLLPQVLKHYEKVLYLDADMVICHDVAELYHTDLEGAMLAAAQDPITLGINKSRRYNKWKGMKNLGIENLYDYFQAGVLLMDLKKMSESGLCDQMIEYAATHDCDLVDQDVLNLFCQGKVKFIDNKWNVNMNSIAMKVVPYAPAAMWKEYKGNRENAYIYHFAGTDKPWNDPFLDKAEIFWEAARRTPWYEVLLENLISSSAFFRKGPEARHGDSVASKLSVWPDNMADMVLPILKAHAELSSIGMSEILAKTIRNADNDYESKAKGKRVMFYGAGNCCKQMLLYFDELGVEYPAVIWDRAARKEQRLFGVPVLRPDFASLKGKDDILFVITIENVSISKTVKASFFENGFTNVIEHKEMMGILSRKLWLKLEDDCGEDARREKQ